MPITAHHITTVPVNIEVKDETPNRGTPNNVIRITVFPQGANPNRHTLATLLVDRGELKRLLLGESGGHHRVPAGGEPEPAHARNSSRGPTQNPDTFGVIPARLIVKEHLGASDRRTF